MLHTYVCNIKNVALILIYSPITVLVGFGYDVSVRISWLFSCP